MAHGNFEDELQLIPGGVEACGPLHWNGTPDDPDVPATKIEVLLVTLTQRRPSDGRVVVGTSTLVGTFMPGDAEWMVNVTDISALEHALGGREFEPGPALAVALILVTAQGRAHVLRERWHESVTITV